MTSRSHSAGIDWASQSHSVCVLDAAGSVELRLDLPHNKEGIERLIRQLRSFAGIVHRARSRGCDHPHAVRILARAWVRVLWRAWFTRTPYQPRLHRSAAALTATTG